MGTPWSVPVEAPTWICEDAAATFRGAQLQRRVTRDGEGKEGANLEPSFTLLLSAGLTILLLCWLSHATAHWALEIPAAAPLGPRLEELPLEKQPWFAPCLWAGGLWWDACSFLSPWYLLVDAAAYLPGSLSDYGPAMMDSILSPWGPPRILQRGFHECPIIIL